ncbi:hypothetical protein [Actinomyces sp. MRS3W]|uniref:hypothetical protein n=1 Tax=Actinomyces sp. MRS3W TaxID=2800796 RepID=UPI0028FD41F2|nr:hypothetical protein [Actinomyces sp. MRS3W]MDU0348526.1 hypothetical protein [Actinomyces sp. MRS3W]
MTGPVRARRRVPRGLAVALVVALAALAAGTVAAYHVVRSTTQETPPAHHQDRNEEQTPTPGCAWATVFDGYGSATCVGSTVTLSPAPATDASQTHAGLATSRTVTIPEGDTTVISATVTTRSQLRTGDAPNPWEVAWLLWSFQDPDHFYALVLKPNGWEVSKQDPDSAGAQQFLASGTEPTFAVGTAHNVTLTVSTIGEQMTVDIAVDGEPLVSVTDTAEPYLQGAVAAYCEDAVVDVSLTPN